MMKNLKKFICFAVAMMVAMTTIAALAEDIAPETVNEEPAVVEIPAEEPVEEIVEEPAEEPVEETVEEPVEEPVEEIIEEPVEEPVEEIIEEPVEETVEEPVEEEIEEVSGINVRADADGLSEIILVVSSLSDAEVIEIEGDWVKVVIDETEGYVHISNMPELKEEEETPEFKVTVFSSRKSFMTAGETVRLTSLIEGFDGYEIRYQWEVDKGDGFEVIEGANGDSYSFEASAETLAYDWRLIVYYR